MSILRSFATLVAAVALGLLPAPAAAEPAPPGPVIELAPEHREPAPPAKPVITLGAGHASDEDLVRGLTERRFRSAAGSSSSTSVGGYGEVQVRGLASGRAGETKW